MTEPLPRPVFVNCRVIDAESRVACAMHHTLKAEEQFWLMIPLDADQIRQIEEIVLGMNDPTKDVIYHIDTRLD